MNKRPRLSQLKPRVQTLGAKVKTANGWRDGKTTNERGYTYAWQKARDRFLHANPLCSVCLKRGEIEPAEVVDHIKPHRGDMSLFWDESNWQALSKRCHDIKTATEDGGFGPRVRTGIDGWPEE